MSMNSQNSSANDPRAPKRPSRRRGHERVAALLEAAASVFAEKGYGAATMTDIAAHAGASIGSLYQFFPTKEDVAAALHARLLEQLSGLLETAGSMEGASIEEILDRLFGELTIFLDANPAFVVLAERRPIDPAVKKANRARLREQIEAMLSIAAPPPPAERRPALAAVLLSAIRTAAQLSSDEDPALRRDAISELKAMLRAHLSASAAAG